MPNNARAYDHLVLCVDELEQAREFYIRAGFTMTPVAIHPFGTHNCLAQLQGNFLEFLSINDASLITDHGPRRFSFAAFNRDFLDHGEGFSMVVFQGEDAQRDAAEFAAKGLSDYEPFDFSRKARLPDGSQVTVSFSLAFVSHKEMPRSAFFTCHQHAPEYFWKPEYQSHENTAQSIVETMMVVDDPMQYAGFFTKLLNSTGKSDEHGGLSFATNGGVFTLLRQDCWQQRFADEIPPDLAQGPRMAGYTIVVDSFEKATQCLSKNDVAFASSQAGVFISAKTAHGCVIEFIEPA